MSSKVKDIFREPFCGMYRPGNGTNPTVEINVLIRCRSSMLWIWAQESSINACLPAQNHQGVPVHHCSFWLASQAFYADSRCLLAPSCMSEAGRQTVSKDLGGVFMVSKYIYCSWSLRKDKAQIKGIFDLLVYCRVSQRCRGCSEWDESVG